MAAHTENKCETLHIAVRKVFPDITADDKKNVSDSDMQRFAFFFSVNEMPIISGSSGRVNILIVYEAA